MTIGLIDPALLLPRAPGIIETELGLVLEACKRSNIRLVPLTEYWPDLWRSLGQALEPTLPPNAKRALQELRKLGAPHLETSVPPLVRFGVTVLNNSLHRLMVSTGSTPWKRRHCAQ